MGPVLSQEVLLMSPMIPNELSILSGGVSYAYDYATFPLILDEPKHAAKFTTRFD
jgi:hypothetical protein